MKFKSKFDPNSNLKFYPPKREQKMKMRLKGKLPKCQK